MVVLAAWLRRHHGYRHRTLSLSALPQRHRHARQTRLRSLRVGRQRDGESDRRTRQAVAGAGDPGYSPQPGSTAMARKVNLSSAATSRARDRSLPSRRLRLGRCDKHRGARSGVFRQRTRQPPAGESEAPRLRLFPRARKSPAHELPSRLKGYRDLAESSTRQDRPAARDSTSRTGARSFGGPAEDYAESIYSRTAARP